jgi:hypothetical protein
MLKAAQQRMHSRQKMEGVVVVKKDLPLSRAIEDLALLLESCAERDLENQIIFNPL